LKTHKLIPENLLDVDIKDKPVRLLQCAGEISTARNTALLELILKPISADFARICPGEFVKTAVNILEACSIGKTA